MLCGEWGKRKRGVQYGYYGSEINDCYRRYSWIASLILAFTPLEAGEAGTPSVLKSLDSGSRLPLCNLVHDTALMEVCDGLGGMLS